MSRTVELWSGTATTMPINLNMLGAILGAAAFGWGAVKLRLGPISTLVAAALGAFMLSVTFALGAAAGQPCTRASLTGTWDVYLVDVTGEAPTDVQFFPLCFAADGRVVAREGCDSAAPGRFVVGADCRVAGALTPAGNALLRMSFRATLSADRQTMMGFGFDFHGHPLTFGAVRR